MPDAILEVLQLLRSAALRVDDLDPLIDLTGQASFVLLGEASHGTHEFHSTRAEITERLIAEKGFQAVAVEADWLREHNDSAPENAPRVGFYGLDLYSLNRSRSEVVRYLEKVDPDAARRARYRYSVFDHFGEDEQAYGYAAGFDLSQSCQQDVVQQLKELQRRAYARQPHGRDTRCAGNASQSALRKCQGRRVGA
jgi:erythromycin esterase-like protein